MYSILTVSRSVEKKFNNLVETLTDQESEELVSLLENTPKGNPTTHTKIKLIRDFWQYDLTRGDRLIYKVYDQEQVVIVYFIGNHNDAQIFLRIRR